MTGWPGVVYVGEDEMPIEVQEAWITQPGSTLEWGIAFDPGVTFCGTADFIFTELDPGFLAFLFCDRDDKHKHGPDGGCVPHWIEMGET